MERVRGLEADQLGRISCSSHHLWALRHSTPPPNFSLLKEHRDTAVTSSQDDCQSSTRDSPSKAVTQHLTQGVRSLNDSLLSGNVNYPNSEMKMVHTFEEDTGHDVRSASSWVT